MPRPQYNRIYFSLVGLGAAFVAVLMFVGLSLRQAAGFSEVNTSLAVSIAFISSTVFYRFPQVLSARSMNYMLWRGLQRWAWVVALTVLGYLTLPTLRAGVSPQLLQEWAMLSIPVLAPALVVMRLTALPFYASDLAPRITVLLQPARASVRLAGRLQRSPSFSLQLIGYFEDPLQTEPHVQNNEALNLPCLGSLDDAIQRIQNNDFDVVFVGMDALRSPRRADIMTALGNSTASFYLVPEAHLLGGFEPQVTDMAGVPLISLHENRILGLSRLIKRSFDIVVSATLLLLLSPLLLLVAVAIKLDSPGPILFRQRRYGHSGDVIWVRKFRSMRYDPSAATSEVRQATRNDPRVTRVGAFIRRTSFDELPQLINVLEGSMSLVGPRPHAAEHNEYYRRQIPGYMLRHTIQPGITGWAQVNGLRGETETMEKMARRVQYDLEYIQNWTLGLDIKILWLTLWSLIRNKDVY